MSGRIEQGRYMRGPQQLSADVVVVGSGASGSVVAAELAEAGLSVVVVEEGGHVPARAYEAMRPSEHLGAVWREGGMTVALGLGDTPVINVTMGRCVGGSSILTGGVCFRTPERVLETWVRKRGLKTLASAEMETYFEEVEREIHVTEVPVSRRSKATTLWEGGAKRALGIEGMHATRRNTKSDQGCSCCNFGCPAGVKMSVDKNYLPRAVAAGAHVLSDCLVERIMLEGDRAVGVVGRLLNRGGRRKGDSVIVHAKRVVLAAGAVHSPLLLMRDGIGRSSRQVGRNLTLHPSFRMTALFGEPVKGWQGAMQSAYTDAFEAEDLFIISVFVPPFAVASAVPGIGPRFMERAGQLDHLAMLGGLIHDEGNGRVWQLPTREPLMTYRMSRRERALLPKLVRYLGEGYLAAGARELYLPILGHDPVDADRFRRMDLAAIPARRYESSSQHPLGTCRMGSASTNSVVDDHGRVWDVRGLYVVDGSVIPTSLGVNPQETIMAMALRLGRLMRDDRLQ